MSGRSKRNAVEAVSSDEAKKLKVEEHPASCARQTVTPSKLADFEQLTEARKKLSRDQVLLQRGRKQLARKQQCLDNADGRFRKEQHKFNLEKVKHKREEHVLTAQAIQLRQHQDKFTVIRETFDKSSLATNQRYREMYAQLTADRHAWAAFQAGIETRALEALDRAPGPITVEVANSPPFVISVQALLSRGSSMLSAMALGSFADSAVHADRVLKIDGDGEFARFVLLYLQTGHLHIPDNLNDVRRLRTCFDFFCVDPRQELFRWLVFRPQAEPQKDVYYLLEDGQPVRIETTQLPVDMRFVHYIVYDNYLFAVGGHWSVVDNDHTTIWRRDLQTGVWVMMAPIPEPCLAHFGCVLVADRMYFIGGMTVENTLIERRSNKVRVYDISTNTHQRLDLTLPLCVSSPACVAKDDILHVIGGVGGATPTDDVALTSYWQINVALATVAIGPCLPASSSGTAFLFTDNTIGVLGGRDNSGSVCSMVRALSTNGWEERSPLPYPGEAIAVCRLRGILCAVQTLADVLGNDVCSTVWQHRDQRDDWVEAAELSSSVSGFVCAVSGQYDPLRAKACVLTKIANS